MSGPSGADFDLLAREHMSLQVHDAAGLQVLLGQVWDLTLDPADLDGSFARFADLALPLIRSGRLTAEAGAQDYYTAFRSLAGLEGPVPAVSLPDEDEAILARLYVTGQGFTKARIAKGVEPAEALALTRTSVLGSAKRSTIAAGRDRLIALGAADPHVSGWARVSDGKPCAFCAMLIGRGPVYSARTVAFRAHDGCGCNVRLVPAGRRDPSGGWADDARSIAAFAVRTGVSLAADYAGFRLAYAAEVGSPGSSLTRVLAETAAGAATAAALKASAYALAS